MSTSFNIAIWEFGFYAPQRLWWLLAIPVVLFLWDFMYRKGNGQLKFSRQDQEQTAIKTGWVPWIRASIGFFYALSFSCIVITLAEPYNVNIDPPKIDYKNGIDIILAIDASGSMLSQDLQPNRLEAAKKVAQEFVDHRKGDRIGLVVYEGEAYTACPATLDYEMLKNRIAEIESGTIAPETAIGNGLGVAVTRLRNDSLPSKVIILLTDGSNTAGTITPLEAAELAKAKNCRVYTIGVGSDGTAPSPVQTPFGIEYIQMPVEIDEVTLQKIAKMTDGKYFRATDEKSLRSIYSEIDKLEKRKMEDQHMSSEPPLTVFPFIFWGLVFLLIGWAIQRWKFRLDD